MNEELLKVLEKAGVKYFSNTDNVDLDEYIRIDPAMAEQLDGLIKGAGIVGRSLENKDDLVRVICEGGVNALDKVKGAEECFRASIHKDGKYAENAILKKAELASSTVSNVMDVASMFVGMYYMAEINSQLDSMGEKLDDIQTFLENGVKSQENGAEKSLLEIRSRLRFILKNDYLRNSAMQQIARIKENAEGWMDLYRTQINDLKNLSIEKDKNETAEKKVLKIQGWLYQYWYALYIHCLAQSLEPLIAGYSEEEYLDSIVEDMMDNLSEYKEFREKCFVGMNEYGKNLKANKDSKVLAALAGLKDVKDIPGQPMAYVQLNGLLFDFVNKQDQKMKSKRKEKLISKITNFTDDESIIMERINDVISFNSFSNGKVDILMKNGEAYFRTEGVENISTLDEQ